MPTVLIASDEFKGSLTAAQVADADNPLTGPKGAAAVYGPQKGATPEQVRELGDALTPFADAVAETTGAALRGHAGAGAADGTGCGALALLGASFGPVSTWYSSWSASRTGSPRLISS
jgi:glycerate kinase